MVRLTLYAIMAPEDNKPEIRPTVTSGPEPTLTSRADYKLSVECTESVMPRAPVGIQRYQSYQYRQWMRDLGGRSGRV